jgi:cytochrome b6-f complex iron-sulfur subunit
MDRKDFLLTGCGLCAAGGVLAYLDSCNKGGSGINFTLDLTSPANSALNTVGGYVIQNSDNAIVIHTSSGYNAFSLVCTHQGCIVGYNGSQFVCPCHGGRYDSNGNVISGPPPSPLQKLTVTQSGNILTIKG